MSSYDAGRCRREITAAYESTRYKPSESDMLIADAIDRLAADVAAIKAKTSDIEWEAVQHFVESEKAWVAPPWQRAKWDEALAIICNGGDWGRGNNFDHGVLGALVIWADKEMDRLTAERDAAIRDRDEARAEVSRLKCSMTETSKDRDAAIRERDEARAEVERLRAELAAQPTAAGWLTEVERQTLLYLRSILSSWGIAPNYQEVKEFYGDLERLDAILDRAGSPPVVEVPALPERTFSPALSAAARVEAQCYRAAMDRAGVPWKEVPRE